GGHSTFHPAILASAQCPENLPQRPEALCDAESIGEIGAAGKDQSACADHLTPGGASDGHPGGDNDRALGRAVALSSAGGGERTALPGAGRLRRPADLLDLLAGALGLQWVLLADP